MATAHYLGITAEEMAREEPERGTGTYAEIEVPGDYELTLARVDDFVSKKGYPGWKFIYQVETSTGPCDFKVWVTFQPNNLFKMKKVLKAHGIDSIENLDPDSLIGEVIGGTINFPYDSQTGQPGTYREIVAFFPLVDAPELEAPNPL